MARKLRIVFSAVCGIVCVLLVVLSVRSYWRRDCVYFRVVTQCQQNTYFDVSSIRGQIAVLALDQTSTPVQMYAQSGFIQPPHR